MHALSSVSVLQAATGVLWMRVAVQGLLAPPDLLGLAVASVTWAFAQVRSAPGSMFARLPDQLFLPSPAP